MASFVEGSVTAYYSRTKLIPYSAGEAPLPDCLSLRFTCFGLSLEHVLVADYFLGPLSHRLHVSGVSSTCICLVELGSVWNIRCPVGVSGSPVSGLRRHERRGCFAAWKGGSLVD